ncbi:mechanosensitive ion channel family protein [Acidobacteria bacterium AH-259-A15]|nr:mechanosensitive ion channel family protein [Acidobacteria bacterium AH-259-A15]
MTFNWLEMAVGLQPATETKLLLSLAVVSALMLVRWLVWWVVSWRTDDVRVRYHVRKISTYVSAGLGLLIVGRIWFTGFRDVGTFLGLLSAGLAIALKDLVASIAGWAYLLWRRPFEVGDRIQIGDHTGDVIDLRLFRFTLMEIGNWVEADQSTGRVIHIPNSRALIDVIANYSKGFQYIWNEIPVLVTFESNWQKAKEILQQIADSRSAHLSEAAMESVRKAAQRAMIIYSTLTPKVWTSIANSGVLLTVRYLCDPRKRRGTEETIWEDILREFHRCDDIDFAYPTVRRFINLHEGKPGIGGAVRASSFEEELL